MNVIKATNDNEANGAHKKSHNCPHCLDLESIRKASQALSGEIVLSRLIKKMMHIVIENAGAEKGSLLLPQQGGWFIEAQGHIDGSDTTVLQSLSLEKTDQVSAGIIYYVAYTRENVVLNDASLQGIFSCDPYIVKYRPKSVLCIPLVNQGQLIGILYLENNLVSGVFTPERIELLNLLSLQIAISIENYFLSKKLEAKIAKLPSDY
jgi:GAF domain-containing protein